LDIRRGKRGLEELSNGVEGGHEERISGIDNKKQSNPHTSIGETVLDLGTI